MSIQPPTGLGGAPSLPTSAPVLPAPLPTAVPSLGADQLKLSAASTAPTAVLPAASAPVAVPPSTAQAQPLAAPTAPVTPAALGVPAALTPTPLAAAPTAPTPIDPQIIILRAQLMGGSSVDATMALAKLQALGATNPAQVVPVLISQLDPSVSKTTVLAAISILQQLHSVEALGALQSLASSPDADIRATAQQAAGVLGGQTRSATPVQPAAPNLPAGSPVAPPQPGTPLPGGQTALSNDGAVLTAKLMDPNQAPAAAVQLAQLPLAQILPITGRLLQDYNPDPRTVDLLVTVLSKHIKEPGVADQLRAVLKKDPATNSSAMARAVLDLMATRNPAYLPDVLGFLSIANPKLLQTKRVLVDALAKNPQALAVPMTTTALTTVLNTGESSDLGAAASHALGLTQSTQARNVLAASPLLNAADPQLRLRAIADLAAQPAPYPAAAIATLKQRAVDTNPQVQQAAQALLKRAGGAK
jgi:hypothetical protein